MKFNILYEDGVVKYDLDLNWRPATHWLVRNIPKEQAFHRSRVGVIALRDLQVQENFMRGEKVREWINTGKFEPYTSGMRNRQTELFIATMDRLLEYLEFDEEHITRYLKSHLGSSIGAGLKWRDLVAMDRTEWRQFYDFVVGLVEQIRAHPGWWLNLDYRTGLRSRSDKIDGFRNQYTGTIDRTRIVMYHPVVSTWFVFMPNKKDLFARAFEDAQRILGIPNHVLLPFVEGGRIYSVAAELFHQHGTTFSAQDGKSWEASVGQLLGPDFNFAMAKVDGVGVLASGHTLTSYLGTLASLVRIRDQPSDTVAILLGDDQNLFGKHNKPAVPWVEEDPGDTRERLILGLGYNQDVDRPRVYGIKAQSDRADKALPLRLQEGVPSDVSMTGRHNERERAAHTGAYLGYYGGGSLLERLRKVDLTRRDYFSPGEVIQEVTTLEDGDDVDAFEWTESFGASVRQQIAKH